MKKLFLILLISSAFISFGQDGEFNDLIVRDNLTVNGTASGQAATLPSHYVIFSQMASASGADSVYFDSTSGDLELYASGVLLSTTHFDGRYAIGDLGDYVAIGDTSSGVYYTQAQVDSLIVGAQQSVFEITLPVAGTLSGSVALATYPAGWVLTANGGTLEIEHNMNRPSASVNVFYNHTGILYRQLRNFTDAYQGHVMDNNNIYIESIVEYYTGYELKIEILLK